MDPCWDFFVNKNKLTDYLKFDTNRICLIDTVIILL